MVLVMMSVLAGIAGPRFAAAAANNRARAAANRIVADLELARERARASSATYSVSFDVTREIYTLDSGNDAVTIDLKRSPYECTLESADFGGTAVISFNAFGVPDNAGAVRVTGGNVAYIVTVAGDTGEVSVQ